MARGVNLTSNARLGDVVHRRGLEVGLGETSQTGDAAGSMISSKAVSGPVHEWATIRSLSIPHRPR